MRRVDQVHLPPLPRIDRAQLPPLPRVRRPEWERRECAAGAPLTRDERARRGSGRGDRHRRGQWALGLLIAALVLLVTPSSIPADPLLRQQGRVVVPLQRGTGTATAATASKHGSSGHGTAGSRPSAPPARPPRALTPTPAPTRIARSTSRPAPTLTPAPHGATNLHMGCTVGTPPGTPPVQPGVIFDGANTALHAPPPEVALTFDDGPTPYSTPPILSYLEQTHTPATFMVEGQYVHLWPSLVQREWHDGFAVGVHTWDHPDMTRLSPAQRQRQLDATLQALDAALGQHACIWFWRPPYGASDRAVVQTAASFGLSTIEWDVDPQDWSRPGTSVIVSRVLTQVHAGSIILLHDGPVLRDQTRAALPGILAGLRARGLVPVTLPKLLEDGGYLRA